MLNGKEIKSVKDMVITATPERIVYSGGSVTLHNPVLFDEKECTILLNEYFSDLS